MPRSDTFHLPWMCAAGAATCVNGTGPLCVNGTLGCSARQRYANCFSATEDADLYGASYVNCTSRGCAGGTFVPGGAGLNQTDFVLYVTAVDAPYCDLGTVLAMGAPCALDTWSGRPLSGNANFCPDALDAGASPLNGRSSSWGMQLDTVMHEALHALGISARTFAMFVADDGSTHRTPPAVATMPDWVVRARVHCCAHQYTHLSASLSRSRAQNGSAAYVVTPTVRAEARAHFGGGDGSSALPGVPLENSGASGTRSSHWEARWLKEDIMAGAKLARSPFSRLTQALLVDSGWYAPTGGVLTPAGGLRWGRGAGDEFVQHSCLARPLPPALAAGGWCDDKVDTGPGCTPDKRATAFCGTDSSNLQDGCTAWTPYGAHRSSICCLCITDCQHRRAANGHCWDATQGTDGASVFGQTYGAGSRCLTSGNASVSRVDWGTYPPMAGCFPMACAPTERNATYPSGVRLLVTISACGLLPCRANVPRMAVAECPPGGYIDLSLLGLGFARGWLGPCPVDALSYCAGLGCPGDCGGDRGACVNPSGMPGSGTCVCNPGYVGDACDEVACTPASCAAADASSVCNPLTGRCAVADGVEMPGPTVVLPQAEPAFLMAQAALARATSPQAPPSALVAPGLTPAAPPPLPPASDAACQGASGAAMSAMLAAALVLLT